MDKSNILFILTDDHAANAMSCYGSKINLTPNIDQIANEGMRFDNCFCTNSICAPSRATILTGNHSHLNGVRTLADSFDGSQQTFPKLLQQSGYQTALIGKWHLGHGRNYDPTGFDYWNILPGQGEYHNPMMIEMGIKKGYEGYVTDLVTDMTINWITKRDKDKPFMVFCNHKAPHRPWEPDEKHAKMYEDIELPIPENFDDDYSTKSDAIKDAFMSIERDMTLRDYKVEPPAYLSEKEKGRWKYQQYIKDYLRCVASIDDNVGRLLDHLKTEGLDDNTLVVYTSDQGFFLGEHGWFDKRFMYEESLRMPLVIKYPKFIKPGSVCTDMVVNTDFAPTFLDYSGIEIPPDIQGRSLKPLFSGTTPVDWRKSMYYRYWMSRGSDHRVAAHYGIRTDKYKLICYYEPGISVHDGLPAKPYKLGDWPQWELFDLEIDPHEMKNVYNSRNYKDIVIKLTEELYKLKSEALDYE